RGTHFRTKNPTGRHRSRGPPETVALAGARRARGAPRGVRGRGMAESAHGNRRGACPMTERLLRSRLEPVTSRQRQHHFWRGLAGGWLIAALFALVVLGVQRALGWASPLAIPIVGLIGIGIALLAGIRAARGFNHLTAAREVERAHPELEGLVLTAAQQHADPDVPLGYLQRRVLRDAVAHSRTHSWPAVVPGRRIAAAQLTQVATLAIFVFALWTLRPPGGLTGSPLLVRTSGVEITPGD